MKKVLIVVPARQREDKFKLHVKSLNRLIIPDDVELKRLFVIHNSRELMKYVNKNDFKWILDTDEEFKQDNIHRNKWKEYNIQTMANMKNTIIEQDIINKYDYLFWIDSDLIVQPETLEYLIKADKDIVSEIFWTDWQNSEIEEPNAWELDEYSFYSDTLNKYRKKGLYKCGGTGACILIKTDVYKKGVNYSPIYNLSFWGEDRAFSIRAACAGYELFVDTNCPCIHLYSDKVLQSINSK